MSEKKLIKHVINNDVQFDMKLGKLKEQVENWIKEYGEDSEIDYEYWGELKNWQLIKIALETDKQYETRIAKEEAAEESNRKYEYAQYLKLKEKFECE
ncbi:MAG: hypothetical protein KKB59_19930 [Spirochaetes bacterium]|nr:hypothetical protein [Spirochaetota bacterium]